MKIIKSLIILLALLGLLSCQQARPVDTVQAHHHASRSFTLFDNNLELFAEIDAFTKGHNSNFMIHLTDLRDYKPIKNGMVTISIHGAQTNFNSVIQSPESPGIYHGKFVAEYIEKVSLTISYKGEQISGNFNLGEFNIYSDDHEAEQAYAEMEVHNPEEIIFTKEKAWQSEFGTMEIMPEFFNAVIPVSGQLEGLPKSMGAMIAPSDGLIQFAQNFMPGQQVRKGDLIFTIDPGQLTSNNLNTKYNEAKSAYEKAESDFLRAENLRTENIISDKEYRKIKLDYDDAKLRFETFGKNYLNGLLYVKATQSGILTEITKKAGDFVNEGDILGTIINTNKLLLKANLPQSQIKDSENIESANFRTALSEKLYTTNELNGKLLSVSSTPNRENGYLPVYFEIENPGNLTTGLFTEIFLINKTKKEVISIPISALIESEGHYHVYVQEDGEGYLSTDVKIGSTDGKRVVVLEGLHAGDRVVIKGAYRIKLASSSGELPSHGHVH